MKPEGSGLEIKTRPRLNGEAGGISHYLQTWATECAMDPETLKKALIRVDYQPKPLEAIPFTVIRKALFGDMYLAELRGRELDNKRKDREERLADGELMRWEDANAIINKRVTPVILAMDAAPEGVSREWVESVLKPAILDLLK